MRSKPRWLSSLLFIAGLTVGPRALADIYSSTLDTCTNHTSFETTLVDRLLYYARFVRSGPFGDRTHFLESAHINDFEVFKRNFKSAAFEFDFAPDQDLRRTIESPDFQRALADCLPESKFPNARKLRAAFVVELVAQQAMGKVSAGASFFIGGAALGRIGGALRGTSRTVFNWVMTGTEVAGAAGLAAHGISVYLENRAFRTAFPRFAEADRQGLSDREKGQAALADFSDVNRTLSGIDSEASTLDATIDETLALLRARLANTRDPARAADLRQKIEVLALARAQ